MPTRKLNAVLATLCLSVAAFGVETPTRAQNWTLADSLSYIQAVGICTRQIGQASARESTELMEELLSTYLKGHGISRATADRIMKSEGFEERIKNTIKLEGGCRELVRKGSEGSNE